MTEYKQDQGRLARMFAFWSCVFLVLFACSFLYDLLVEFGPALSTPFGADENGRGGMQIPIVRVDLNAAFLISSFVFIGAFLIIQRWQARPKVADFLIETELELRKVTWPTWPEVFNSSMVVIATVLFLMGFLALSDWAFGNLFKRLLLG
ncbi:MAG: preprotein translocase subunit SecE [Planctomycetota bacterium]